MDPTPNSRSVPDTNPADRAVAKMATSAVAAAKIQPPSPPARDTDFLQRILRLEALIADATSDAAAATAAAAAATAAAAAATAAAATATADAATAAAAATAAGARMDAASASCGGDGTITFTI